MINLVSKSSIYLLFFLTIFGNGFQSRAQSSDRVRYYVLYDVSGSMENQDSNKNIPLLVRRMIQMDLKKRQVESGTSLEIHFFGEKIQPEVRKYDRYGTQRELANDGRRIADYFQKLNRATTAQEYTHVLSGLQNVLNLDTNKWKETFGVFILTDGQLREGDINLEDLKGEFPDHDTTPIFNQYKSEVKSAIKRLEDLDKPVFVIQSSPQALNLDGSFNDFFSVNESLLTESRVAQDTLMIGERFFWVNSKVNLNESNNEYLLKYFDSFLIEANSAVINAKKSTDLSEISLVSKAVTFNNLLRLTDLDRMENPLFPEIFANTLDSEMVDTKNAVSKVLNLNHRLFANSTLSPLQINLLAGHIERDLTEENLELALKFLGNLEEDVKRNSSLKIPTSLVFDKQTKTTLETSRKNIDRTNLQEALVLGLADYLIERSKQEALFILYENLNNNLFEKNLYLKNTLFFHFSHLIEGENSDLSLVLLKEALIRDIKLFPRNLALHPNFKQSELLLALANAYFLIEELSKSESLEVAFKKLNSWQKENINKGNHLEIGLLFTTELISYLHENNLQDAYDKLAGSKDLDRITRIIAIWFADNYSDLGIIDIPGLSTKITSLYREYSLIRGHIIDLENELEKLDPTSNFSDYASYKRELVLNVIRKVVSLLIAGIDVLEHFSNDASELTRKSKAFLYKQKSQAAIDAWFMIKNENYTQAVALILPHLPPILDSNGNNLNDNLSRFVAIAGEVTAAKTAGDVKNTLSKYALPVASYRLKRQEKSTLMINAYTGGAASYFPKATCKEVEAILMAPIGIEKSWKTNGKSGSISLFGSLFDLGNVINYRLDNEDSEVDKVIRIDQIVSPGVFLVFGLSKKFPLSLLIGGQLNPERISAGLTFDLPLFRIR